MRRWGEERFQVTGATGACIGGKVTPAAAEGATERDRAREK